MSGTTIALVLEGTLLALALIFIVALLRSHAEILRRLDDLDEASARGGSQTSGSATSGPPLGQGGATGSRAYDIAGETLHGDAVKVSLTGTSPRTLLAFLSSTCTACGPLWTGLEHPEGVAEDFRTVVVTKGPERERLARLLELAPDGADVVMSTPAWEQFEIPATPHFVLVQDGSILGRGSATSWEQIGGLLADARADDAVYSARTTDERAARAEAALASAGITDGHPSLYPSRNTESGERQ